MNICLWLNGHVKPVSNSSKDALSFGVDFICNYGRSLPFAVGFFCGTPFLWCTTVALIGTYLFINVYALPIRVKSLSNEEV